MKQHFIKTLKKFSENAGTLAHAFQQGADSILSAILTTGDNMVWTELELRIDGNGNKAWYVDLYSRPWTDRDIQ